MQDIYSYDDPLEFIAERLTAKFPGISHREFAERMGMKSSATLSHILSGRRKISERSRDQLAGVLELSPSEFVFFDLLIQFQQAKTPEVRNEVFHRISRARSRSKAFRSESSALNYFSRWYYAAIMEFLYIHREFTLNDSSRIGKSLYPRLSSKEVRKALDSLLEMGMLQEDEQGFLSPKRVSLTAEGLPLSALRNRNRELLQISVGAQDDFKRQQRNISSVTMAMSEERFNQISEKIDEFRKWILDSEDEPESMDRVVQINFAAHPLSVAKEEV